MNTKKCTAKKVHLEWLRILAIFCVLFNHTGTRGFLLFTVNRESVFYGCYMFMAIAIKVAVPVFFMISGALLLTKEEPLTVVLKKRVLKFFIMMLAGSLIVYLHKLNGNFSSFSLRELGEKLYIGNVTTAYWYFYAYLAFLLMLPLLRKLAKAMSNQEYIYMIGMYLLIQMFSVLQLYSLIGLHYNENFAFFITEQIVFYPLLGYYVEHRLPEKYYHKKTLLVLIAASILAIVLCCLMTHRYCTIFDRWDESHCQKYFELLIFIPAMTLYFGSKLSFEKVHLPQWMEKIIVLGGSCTFGIFLFERIYRTETQRIYDLLCPHMPSLVACVIWVGCACLLGFVVTWLLKKLPVVKKYL